MRSKRATDRPRIEPTLHECRGCSPRACGGASAFLRRAVVSEPLFKVGESRPDGVLAAVEVTLGELVRRARRLAQRGERVALGITGTPGAGSRRSTRRCSTSSALAPYLSAWIASTSRTRSSPGWAALNGKVHSTPSTSTGTCHSCVDFVIKQLARRCTRRNSNAPSRNRLAAGSPSWPTCHSSSQKATTCYLTSMAGRTCAAAWTRCGFSTSTRRSGERDSSSGVGRSVTQLVTPATGSQLSTRGTRRSSTPPVIALT